MSQYKSAIRAQSQQESSGSLTHLNAAHQLQELFTTWTVDDLQLLLSEVNGDVDLAATKIYDGTAVPWGEVSRKKDKKVPTPAHTPKPSTSGRGDSRGTRGGRGGRGGAGRGGAVNRGGRGGSSKSGTNGHVPHADSAHSSHPGAVTNGLSSDATEHAKSDAPNKVSSESHEHQNGVTPSSSSGWTDTASQPENPTMMATVSGGTSSTASWGHSTDANGSPATHAPAPRQASKTPATSKLSWAQVARPQEKVTPPLSASSQAQPLVVDPQVIPSVPIVEAQPEREQSGWEEPTTVEPPTWDEPKHNEVWGPTEPVPEAPKAEFVVGTSQDPEIQEGPGINALPDVVAETTETLIAPPSVAHGIPQTSSILPSQVTPSPKLTTRPTVSSHRSSARYKISDQPVTLPLSFGSGIEKVGMQFGSLNLGDNMTEPSQPEPEVIPIIPEPTPAPMTQPKVEPVPSAPAPPATVPATSTSLASVFQQPQQLPASAPQPQAPSLPSTVPHHTLPSSVSQPIASSQATAHTTTSPLQTSAQQPINHNIIHQQPQPQPQLQQTQHLPHLPQQLQQQNQTVHPFNQHGLPLHLESSQQTQTSMQQQPPQSATHSTYFRGADASATTPYFHAPTPPVTQGQDNSYNSFGQLGTQNQHQASHLAAFGNNDYGYSDSTRDFYGSYPQQGFVSRNPLAHEDVKGLSSGQQPSTTAVPQSNAQGPTTHSSQPSNQAQTPSGQGPQQYPPPVPYYYPPYSQGQFYGSPYSSGYVPQPFVNLKFPTMFQHGPPGPASSANPATKQPGGNVSVQPQTNPYNQLYQQAGYDDYQVHPQHHHQHSHSLGLGQGGVGDYSKQLYGGAGGNMQGFIGLSGQTAAGPTSNTGPRGSGSPDTHYKPYTSKDVGGVTSGRNVAGQNQVPPQSQNQGPAAQGTQGQSFYGGNRFGTGVASSAGGPQQSGPQNHLAYPQAVNEPSYYPYQPRQQPFWS